MFKCFEIILTCLKQPQVDKNKVLISIISAGCMMFLLIAAVFEISGAGEFMMCRHIYGGSFHCPGRWLVRLILAALADWSSRALARKVLDCDDDVRPKRSLVWIEILDWTFEWKIRFRFPASGKALEFLDWDHLFNFDIEKIDQKGSKFDIKQQFYTKSTPQNPMS